MWRQAKVIFLLVIGVVSTALVLTFSWSNRHLVELKAWGLGNYQIPAWAVLGIGFLMAIAILIPITAFYVFKQRHIDQKRKTYISSLKQELDALRNQPLLEETKIVSQEQTQK